MVEIQDTWMLSLETLCQNIVKCQFENPEEEKHFNKCFPMRFHKAVCRCAEIVFFRRNEKKNFFFPVAEKKKQFISSQMSEWVNNEVASRKKNAPFDLGFDLPEPGFGVWPARAGVWGTCTVKKIYIPTGNPFPNPKLYCCTRSRSAHARAAPAQWF